MQQLDGVLRNMLAHVHLLHLALGTGTGCQFLGLMQIGWCPSESCNVTVANVTCEFFRHALRGQA